MKFPSKTETIILISLLVIGGLLFMKPKIPVEKPKTSLEAIPLAKSLFENYQFHLGTEYKRLIYEYPRDQVPSDQEFFYVNITIPDNIANELDQLAAKYPKLKDAFYPRVYAASLNPTTPPKFNYYRPFDVYYLEKTPHGIPKKLQVLFKTADVPSNAKYLVVTVHTPFFEDWDDNSLFCYGIDGLTDPEGQWTAVKLERNICIASRYDRHTYTSWRILNDPIHVGGWSVLKREIDLPIDPNKPLYMKWGVDSYGAGGREFVIGLQFELNNSSTYFVAFRAFRTAEFTDCGSDDYHHAFTNVAKINCAFILDKNNQKIDIAAYIRQKCNIDWEKVRSLKTVYIALRDDSCWEGDGHILLSYLWIGDQQFIQETGSTS